MLFVFLWPKELLLTKTSLIPIALLTLYLSRIRVSRVFSCCHLRRSHCAADCDYQRRATCLPRRAFAEETPIKRPPTRSGSVADNDFHSCLFWIAPCLHRWDGFGATLTNASIHFRRRIAPQRLIQKINPAHASALIAQSAGPATWSTRG